MKASTQSAAIRARPQRCFCWPALAAAAALLLAAQAAAAAAAAAEAAAPQPEPELHNVLERFPTARLRWSVGVTGVGSRAAAAAAGRGIHITYNTTELRHSGQWVEVSWRGVADPQPTDLLAVYSPPNAYALGRAPIKFANASDAADHLAGGRGRLALRLVNLREDLRVVFVRGGGGEEEAPVVAAEGPVIRNLNRNEPTGIHLMRTRSPSEMLVQFTTRSARAPLARYGLRPGGPYPYTVPATTATYTAAELCGPPASGLGWHDPGLLHTATLTGLAPGQLYYYQVGDAESGLFSGEYSFRAPPPVGPDQTVHILTLADQGVGEVDGSYAAMEYAPAADVAKHTVADGLAGAPDGRHYSLVLHNGDIAYARGYGALWDAFLLQQQELAARVPYMVCVGNHERDHPTGPIPYHTIDSGGECGVPYEARFPMPSAGRDRPWYSFEHGPVHFTVMSTEHYFGSGSPQHAWLAADLAGVDRARTPWLVLIGHRPIYIDADEYWEQGKQTTAIQLQMALEHLLAEFRVDVALSGHHHSYQRTCPVMGQACRDPRQPGAPGVVHLCVGHAGAQWYDNGFAERPAWVAYENQLIHGHARLHVNATHFHIQAIDSEGQLFDEALLTKAPSTGSAGSSDSSGSGAGSGRAKGAGGEQPSLFAQRAEALAAAA